MTHIASTKFKITCLSVMEEVRKTRQPVRITRYGKPVAEIIPITPDAPLKKRELGFFNGMVEIQGDIVAPIIPSSDWDTLQGIWEPGND